MLQAVHPGHRGRPEWSAH